MANYQFIGTQKVSSGKLKPIERIIKRKFETDNKTYPINALIEKTKSMIHHSATKIELIGKIYEITVSGQIVNEQKIEISF